MLSRCRIIRLLASLFVWEKFVVITDHSALQWISKIKKPNSRLFKWSLKLSQYHFEIRYRPGAQNVEADVLSRSPVRLDFHHQERLCIVNLISIDELKITQNEEKMKGFPLPSLLNNEGIAVKRKGLFTRYYTPVSLRAKIVDKFHHEFGHIGVKKMLLMISKSYYWSNMTDDVKKFVETCEVCLLNKVKRSPKLGTLSITGPAENPFDIISIDTVGGFEGYQSSKKYLHLAIDHFTLFVWFRTSKTQKSHDSRILIETIFNLGKPKLLISDNYPGITSRAFRLFLEKHDIDLKLVPPYCPKSNGMIERVNQTILDSMRCKYYEHDRKISWQIIAQQSIYEYNNTLHSATGFTPKFLLMVSSLFENNT